MISTATKCNWIKNTKRISMVGFVLIQLQLPLQHAPTTSVDKRGWFIWLKVVYSRPRSCCRLHNRANEVPKEYVFSHTTICFVFKFRPDSSVANNTLRIIQYSWSQILIMLNICTFYILGHYSMYHMSVYFHTITKMINKNLTYPTSKVLGLKLLHWFVNK